MVGQAPSEAPLGNGFTYQGQLQDGGSPANGRYDFLFRLFDAPIAGNQIGPFNTLLNRTVTNGLFTITLTFGAGAFDGEARYLEIAVRPNGGGTYTTLSPRQPVTPAPYALYALKSKGYKGVVTVAKDGGDYTTLTAALDSITDASSTNPYLVWIGPGVYTETVTMKEWVDLEGSGENATTISQVGSDTQTTGTLIGASHTEVRHLTVRNTGGNNNAIAVYNSGVVSTTRYLHVTASASGESFNAGVYNTSSSPIMDNFTATASGGTYSSIGVYNTSSSSPSMNNVTATASDGTDHFGVSNSGSSSPIMNNVMATASGGTFSYGVANSNSSSPIMRNVTATASGASNGNYGLFNSNNSSPTIEGSSVEGSGGSSSYGLYNSASSGTSVVTVSSSSITGGTNTIRSDAEFTTRVGSSRLSGGPVVPNGGVVTCADTHDENNNLLPHNCLNHSANVVEVAKSGVKFSSIQAALASIPDASPTNRYLVRVGPGVYTETVTMKEWVDIEGSGEDTTTISQVGNPSSSTGTVIGASNSGLRSLTVRNTGGNSYSTAIYNSGVDAAMSIEHVSATASGSSIASTAIYNNSSSPSMSNMTITASDIASINRGVYNTNASSPVMSNITISVSLGSPNEGVYNSSSSPIMRSMTIITSGGTGTNRGVYNLSSSSPTMSDISITASGSPSGYGVSNSTTSSPAMSNMRIVASGSSSSYGVWNAGSSSPDMTNITIKATAGNTSDGIYNSSSSSSMRNITVTASGGSTSNRGVSNIASSSTMSNMTILAAGGAETYGIFNQASSGSYTVMVDVSKVEGSTNSIRSDGEFTTRVGSSKLAGGPVLPNGGTVTCAGVHDENYAFFASTCP
jgi:pectin methylesterase-like acyl-CoA thioesterase